MSGTYAASYGSKPAAAVLDYAYSFADEITENEPGDTITGATLTISPADGALGASQIVASATGVTFWLSGGIVGATYELSIIATTAGGRTLVAWPAPMIAVE